MSWKTNLALMSVVAAFLTGCRNDRPVAPRAAFLGASDGISAERIQGGVRLTNGSSGVIMYVVWDEGFLGLLAPCTSSSQRCPTLKPGDSVNVKEDGEAFSGYGNATVYVWTVGQLTDEPQTLTVPDGKPRP